MLSELSRRNLFKTGSSALAGAALVAQASNADAATGQAARNEQVLRTWYGLWTTHRDWAPFAAILADDFTFSSPNGDDHISKARFKERCWAPNVSLTQGFDLELMMARGDRAMVQYLGHTTTGKSFRNVEVHSLRAGQITSTVCFFGANMSFPSGLEAQKS